MNEQTPAADANAQLRHWIYALLIALTAAQCAARILNTHRVYEPGVGPWPNSEPLDVPTYGSNDRARWDTVRALVDNGTYAIGYRTELPPYDNLPTVPVEALRLGRMLGYFGAMGELGPTPLPPPMYVDSGIVFEDGWTSIDKVLNPSTKEFLSTKPQLLPTTVAGEYWLLKKVTGWTLTDHRYEMVRMILFTINWLPLVIYLVLLSRLVERWGTTDWGRLFVMATACFGTFLTTFITVFNNHTMAAFSVLSALYPLLAGDAPLTSGRLALSGFLAGWAATNELPAAAFAAGLFLCLLKEAPRGTLLFFTPAVAVPVLGLVLTDYLSSGEWVPVYTKFDTVWYNFAGAYWAKPRGIDAGTDSTPIYAFHMLVGHHGIFSLSPIYLLSFAAASSTMLRNGRSWHRAVALLTLSLSIVVFVFYLRQTKNYTYGGWTSGLRWFFWLIPLWLLTMIPAADWLAERRWGRWLGYLLLAVSVLSASYPAWNPWRHPWLYNFLDYLDVIKYG
jgi:hypothetical protein